ncbi:conserved hypothetical protein [Microcystis aeruginosa PCC 9432]|jgi:hypothetical protein|uniref:Sulfotransferase domain-containing protein n=2 Tax=Microcystis aeruginosa TaxID=1126 RepID=A0A822LDC0_MICAE|nr:conserved hypothetical protein [Microcystis aeruginosa PCC 9432]
MFHHIFMKNLAISTDTPILAYFGHHKAGSSWILKVVYSVCSEIGIKSTHFHSPKMFNFDLAEAINRNKIQFLSYTNADINYVNPILQNFKGFHVIRDPRDTVVSAYFSHLYSHSDQFWPELVDYRKQLEKVSKDEGLFLTMEHLERLKYDGVEVNVFKDMFGWNYSCPNIMEIKFEELVSNPYSKFLDIFQFLGILEKSNNIALKSVINYRLQKVISKLIYSRYMPVNNLNLISFRSPLYPWRLLSIVYDNNFIKLSGARKPGEENIKSHYRKGIAGDWKNHFNDEHKQYFKEKYNSLLSELGYEIL